VFANEDGSEVVQMRERRTKDTAESIGVEGGGRPPERYPS
jgi:hypothetical protein